MLREEQVAEVKALLARRDPPLSQRQIAILARVSRGSVKKILDGRWHLRVKPAAEPDSIFDGQPPSRCGICGRMVQKPCLVCTPPNKSVPSRQPQADDFCDCAQIQMELRGEAGERFKVLSAEKFLQSFPPQGEAAEDPTPAGDEKRPEKAGPCYDAADFPIYESFEAAFTDP